MKNERYYLGFLILAIIFGCQKFDKKVNQQLIAINPISYTDVTYCSEKDTVLVSTYSGRISKRIKGQEKEIPIIQLNDEIYSLRYARTQNLAVVSTYRSGIVIVNIETGKIVQQLNLKNETWINSIHLSNDENYLMGFDVKGENYIWDLKNNYEQLDFSEELPNSFIRYVDDMNNMFYQSKGKYLKWNPIEKKIVGELKIQGKLIDIDEKGNLLYLNFNKFGIFSKELDSTIVEKKHPYYIYQYTEKDTVHIPVQLKLTDALFSKNKVYTSSLDKSIRVWAKVNGELLDEWYEHNATISSMDITTDKNQMVSVDLKGGIKYWDLE